MSTKPPPAQVVVDRSKRSSRHSQCKYTVPLHERNNEEDRNRPLHNVIREISIEIGAYWAGWVSVWLDARSATPGTLIFLSIYLPVARFIEVLIRIYLLQNSQWVGSLGHRDVPIQSCVFDSRIASRNLTGVPSLFYHSSNRTRITTRRRPSSAPSTSPSVMATSEVL